MELQRTRTNGRQKRIGCRSQQYQRGGFRRLLENFEEDVGVIPAHRIRAVENEQAPLALRLERGGALHGAQLAHANHRPCHGRPQAYGIGNDQPDIGMRLDDERRAFDGGGIGAFTALGKAGLDERCRVGERSHPPARIAFATKIILEALAVGGLREHARERVFSDAARPGEKQRAGNAPATEHAAKRAHDALVAEKCVEAHSFIHGVSPWLQARTKCALRWRREHPGGWRRADAARRRRPYIRSSPSSADAKARRIARRRLADA